MNKYLDIIKKDIEKWWNFQPILFIWPDINNKVSSLIDDLFKDYGLDFWSIFKLVDDGEKIKISTIRDFISKWDLTPSFLFQVFLVENISRLTLESSNSCLKFLEEPWVWNIIILTNKSESQVLDTILSRVRVFDIWWSSFNVKSEFYYDMIDDFLNKKNTSLVSYFFDDKKLSKQEYISFLDTFISYIKSNPDYTYLLDQVYDSMNLILNNNVLPKYEIDKILLKIKK